MNSQNATNYYPFKAISDSGNPQDLKKCFNIQTVSELINILKQLENQEGLIYLNGSPEYYLFSIKANENEPDSIENTAYVFSDTSEPFWDEELEVPPDDLLVSLQSKI